MVCLGDSLQVRLSKSPATLHDTCARRTVTVVGQLHQVGCKAIVRQLVLTVEGVCGKRRDRQPNNMWVEIFS